MAKLMKRSRPRKRSKSSGPSTSYGGGISTPPSPVTVKSPKVKKSPLSFTKNWTNPLEGAFKAGSNLSKWGETTVAILATGLTFGVLSSAARYATYGVNDKLPAGSVKNSTSTVLNEIPPDLNLALQSAGIVGSAYLVGQYGEQGLFKNKDAVKNLMTVAYGVAGYRLLTGISSGDVGRRMSSMFDGRLSTMVTPASSPMINTPAQANAFRSAFRSVDAPGIFTGAETNSYAMKHPNQVRMILNNNVPWYGVVSQ
jgi:hypothetical protein